MNQEESIYNIIPQKKIRLSKSQIYHSKFSYNIPPTGSTFLLQGTSFPNISNMGGLKELPIGGHPMRGEAKTIGRQLGYYCEDPLKFKLNHLKLIKKNIIIPKNKSLSTLTKPKVPTLKNKPIILPRNNNNFIISNAVDAILSQPKINKNFQKNYLKKKNYGKVPNYIKKIKQQIEEEKIALYDMKKKKEEEETKKKYKLREEEIKTLREGLLKKLAELRKNYGLISHRKIFDTLLKIKHKESLEKEMNIVEKDLKLLNHKNIIVDMTS